MLGNEVEDGYCRLYQLGNSLQELNSSAVFGGNLSVLDRNFLAQNLTHPNPKNLQQLESVKGSCGEFVGVSVTFDKTRALREDYSKGLFINDFPDKNEFLLLCKNFEPKQSYSGSFHSSSCYDQRNLNSRGIYTVKAYENECADSPTLTTNSERSEITEASGDFNFLRGQEQVVWNTRSQAMQQSGCNDMQLLQQQVMLKQLQEFQRQQPLQQLGETRQQSFSHIAGIAKQGAASQFSNLINGMPVNDASQMQTGWMHRGSSPNAQAMFNKVMLSQDQAQALRAMGLAPQLNDDSLNGTPISNVRGSVSRHGDVQGASHESVNSFSKATAEAPKSSVQSPGFGYMGNVPSDLVGFAAGSFELKQGLRVKDTIGQVPIQGLNTGFFSGNIDSNPARVNASIDEFRDRQDRVGWSGVQQTPKQVVSQNSVPLDPLEAKILYNMDGNIWDAFEGRPDMVGGGFGNMMEQPDSSDAVPCIQSGSWSALMQSAVAEASSSDTGLQEEWSGLTFQNNEHSTDNQMSNFMESENRQTGQVDNNLQSHSASSFTSKSLPLVTDTGISSTFPGFQQPGIKLSTEQRGDLCQDGSRELIGNYKHQEKLSVEEGQGVQASVHSNNSWTSQMFGYLRRDGQNVALHDVSMENRGNESMGKTHHQMTSSHFIAHNSSEEEHQTFEKQHHFFQRGNSNGGFTNQGFSCQGHGQFEENKAFDNSFMNVRNEDEMFSSDFHRNSIASDEVPSTSDRGANASASLHRSDFNDSSNAAPQPSENTPELLHKVGNSRDDNSIEQLGSTANCSSLRSAAAVDTHGLRLATSSQRLPNSISFLPSEGFSTVSNQNSMASFQAMSSADEQGAQWDNRSGNSGHSSMLSSVSSLTRNLSHPRNQLQTSTSNVSVASQPGNPTCSAGRFPPKSPSQDPLQLIYATSKSQQFPVLEASAISQPSNMSSMSQGEGSPKPHNVWRTVPMQRRSFSTEQAKLSSGLPSSIDLSNSLSRVPHGIHNQKSVKAWDKPSEYGASSNSQEPISDASFRQSSSVESHQQQDVYTGRLENNAGAASTERNLGGLDHSHGYNNNLPIMQQLHALNNSFDAVSEFQQATDLGEQHLHDSSSRFRQSMDTGPNLGSQPNSFQVADSKMLSLIGEARDSPSLKTSLQSALQAGPSEEMGIHGQNESQAQSSSGDAPLNHLNHSSVNLPVTASWFKRYGTHRNPQMVPIFDPRFSKAAAEQFSLGRPLILQSQTLERSGANDAGQFANGWPSRATTLVSAGQQLSPPFVFPAEATDQISITKPKKRKFEPSLHLPWHKEALQASERLQDISVSEEEWCHATNRVIEKVEYNEMMEDLQPWLRSKRRLILTTQLVQCLFSVGPVSIYHIDSSKSHHVLSYFTTRLSLGDACRLSYCRRNNLRICTNNDDLNLEKLKFSEETSDKQMSEAVEAFIDRAKKMEQEFGRLDKAASMVDLRVDLQELEKFSVINRFARFHSRGHADASGTSISGLLRPIVQRYVTAVAMPKILPEDAKCLSL